MGNKGGRPSTSTWTAILNYIIIDEDGNEEKAVTLRDENGSMYWENKATAVAALAKLQIDSEMRVDIFIRDNDSIKIIKPQAQTLIKYDINEEEPKKKEEVPEEKQEETLIKETPDDVIDKNLKDIIEEDKQENEMPPGENPDDKNTNNELPDIGEDE